MIGDSKKLYSRRKPKALEHLERGVLGALAMQGTAPASLRQLLETIGPDGAVPLEEYPWYRGEDLPLPHCISPMDVKFPGNSLRTAAKASALRCLAIRCEPVLVGQYNRHVNATQNKSTTLFDVSGRLLYWLWRKCEGKRLRVVVDRQGGRTRYLSPLQRIFHGADFRILEESDTVSAYRIRQNGKVAEIVFTTGAESKHLPVALASMPSKYIRELFMELLNRFWARHVLGLTPTAGYYTDGRRFFKEIASVVRRMGLSEELLYRSR